MLLSQQLQIDPPARAFRARKLAPRKIFYKSRARVRNFYPQLCDTSGKNAPANDNSASGPTIREYIYLNGAPLAQITAGSPETLAYIHTDHLGTPRFATNSGGTQVWAWTNDAFGTSTPTGTVTVNLRMPGQYFDSESGLFYNWNRYYNPAIGRYLSSDPIGIDGGLNTFLYTEANPVNGIDSDGQATAVLPAAGTLEAPTVLIPLITVCTLEPWLCAAGLVATMSLSGDTPDTGTCQMATGQPSAASCSKAIKLLEQAVRLAGSQGAKLSEDRKKQLQDKINAGTITSGDLPGGIQGEFPGEFKGMTLNDIRRICGKSR